MTKRAEQNKISSTANGVALEHNTVYDDNLLPAADELAKLNALDPDIVPWVKKRTEIEQNARIKFNLRRTALAFREINYSAFITFAGLVLCVAIIAGIFYLSYDLIIKGHETAGIAFGGGDVVGVLMIINKFKLRKDK